MRMTFGLAAMLIGSFRLAIADVGPLPDSLFALGQDQITVVLATAEDATGQPMRSEHQSSRGDRKYRTTGVLLAFFPGSIVHGMGHFYAGDGVTGTTMLGIELASIIAISVSSNAMPADSNAFGPAWATGVALGGTLLFVGSWLWDLFMTPSAIEHWNVEHGFGSKRRSLIDVGFDAVKLVIGLPSPPPTVRPATVSATAGFVVAVAAFAAEGVGIGDAAVAADWVRAGLVQAGTVSVVERERIDAVLGEQAFQQTGCTREDCAVRLGRLINAQRIVVGRVAAFLGEFVVTVGVVDVETGRVMANETARGRNADELAEALRSMSDRLATAIR